MPYDWNRHKPAEEGGESKYWKATNKGDTIAGIIIDINETNFGGSRPDHVPNLVLQVPNGSVREVGCAQVNLLRQVAEQGPQIGDHIAIEYLGEGAKQPGKNPPKLFKVVVAKVDGPVPASVAKAIAGSGDEPF